MTRRGQDPQTLSQAQGCHLRSQQQQRLQQQQCWQARQQQRQQLGLCWLCKKYGVGCVAAARHRIFLQPAKSELLPWLPLLLLPLLPALLLLKPLPLLTSQMVSLGLTQRLRGLTSQLPGLTSQLLGLTLQLPGLTSQLLGLTPQPPGLNARRAAYACIEV